ncbi:hypothetical protein ISCGN_031070 [Ixodes scapularis]
MAGVKRNRQDEDLFRTWFRSSRVSLFWAPWEPGIRANIGSSTGFVVWFIVSVQDDLGVAFFSEWKSRRRVRRCRNRVCVSFGPWLKSVRPFRMLLQSVRRFDGSPFYSSRLGSMAEQAGKRARGIGRAGSGGAAGSCVKAGSGTDSE